MDGFLQTVTHEKPLGKKFFGVNGDIKSSVETGMRKGQLNWVKCLILDPDLRL